MDNLEFQKLLQEQRAKVNIIGEELKATFVKLTEGAKFPTGGFQKFFENRLKKTGYYDDAKEIKSEAKDAISTMKYDMKNGDTLYEAFNKACRDLYIDPDGIEKYI